MQAHRGALEQGALARVISGATDGGEGDDFSTMAMQSPMAPRGDGRRAALFDGGCDAEGSEGDAGGGGESDEADEALAFLRPAINGSKGVSASKAVKGSKGGATARVAANGPDYAGWPLSPPEQSRVGLSPHRRRFSGLAALSTGGESPGHGTPGAANKTSSPLASLKGAGATAPLASPSATGRASETKKQASPTRLSKPRSSLSPEPTAKDQKPRTKKQEAPSGSKHQDPSSWAAPKSGWGGGGGGGKDSPLVGITVKVDAIHGGGGRTSRPVSSSAAPIAGSPTRLASQKSDLAHAFASHAPVTSRNASAAHVPSAEASSTLSPGQKTTKFEWLPRASGSGLGGSSKVLRAGRDASPIAVSPFTGSPFTGSPLAVSRESSVEPQVFSAAAGAGGVKKVLAAPPSHANCRTGGAAGAGGEGGGEGEASQALILVLEGGEMDALLRGRSEEKFLRGASQEGFGRGASEEAFCRVAASHDTFPSIRAPTLPSGGVGRTEASSVSPVRRAPPTPGGVGGAMLRRRSVATVTL
ncbi:hypothetical protein T484DRAFT_3475979 [Baffinella frigidus]|nr:hypothetical protein T484DRAFT_3475979 [Cryptophyta sp. CCMP2293]